MFQNVLPVLKMPAGSVAVLGGRLRGAALHTSSGSKESL